MELSIMIDLSTVSTDDLVEEMMHRVSTTYAVDAEHIINAVVIGFSIPSGEILGRGRTQRLAHARMIAMSMIRKMRKESLSRVGAYFGRDHGTVVHALKSVPQIIKNHGYAHEVLTACIELAEITEVSKTSVNQALLDLNFLKSPDSFISDYLSS